MSTQVKVYTIPDCDVCKGEGRQGVPAFADAKLSAGPWANVCRNHFDLYHCALGTGKGQQFVLREESPKPEMTFEAWLQLVDRELVGMCGFTHADLPDTSYHDMYDDGCTPTEVAGTVLAEEFRMGLE